MTEKNESVKILYYTSLETDLLGTIWLAASERGLIAIRFEEDSADFLSNFFNTLNTTEPINIFHDKDKLQPFIESLQIYFTEKKQIPQALPVDLFDQTSFQQEILNLIRQIPFGSTTTYGELAEKINNPNAARAIGQVLRRNPIPIIIPCHRVLNADGTLGGYGGVMGSERKIALLKHENVILA